MGEQKGSLKINTQKEKKMIINKQEYSINSLNYTIRSAREEDAEVLSALRVQIDGETENLDREKGEAYIDTEGFKKLIKNDSENEKNLFLVADVGNRIVAYSRCEGNDLKRFSHKVEFGVCVSKEFWGYTIGKKLLYSSVSWADANNIRKITLNVLETNEKAIKLYKTFGFEVEGILREDKKLSDGQFYNTIVMGRLHSNNENTEIDVEWRKSYVANDEKSAGSITEKITIDQTP